MLPLKEQNKLDSKVQSLAKQAKKVGYIALVGGAAGFAIWCLVSFNLWSQTHRFQSPQFRSPIVFRNPIVRGVIETRARVIEAPVVKEVKAQVVPTRVPDALEDYIDEAYKTVLFKESSNGKNLSGLNGYCISQGGINQVGYGVHSKYCFKDVKEQEETVRLWFRNRITGMKEGICNDIQSCLLVYSGGAYSTIEY